MASIADIYLKIPIVTKSHSFNSCVLLTSIPSETVTLS